MCDPPSTSVSAVAPCVDGRTARLRGRAVTSAVEPLGPATVMWNDFVGSAAADGLNGPSLDGGLYELAGLNPQKWLILGIDLLLEGGLEHARVYALDRVESKVDSQHELLELAYHRGELIVDAFEIDAVPPPAAPVRSMFQHVAVRLIARGVSDQRLVVRSAP